MKLKLKHIIILIIVLVIAGFIFIPIGEFNRSVQKGNTISSTDELSKVAAYQHYLLAKNEWSFLSYNYWFRKKFTEAKQAFEQNMSERPAINVFFKNNFKQSEVNNLINELKQKNSVREVRFISKEDALKIYQEQNKDDPQLVNMVTADLLPGSLEVYMSDWNKQAEIRNYLESLHFIETVSSLDQFGF